ncbi:uncharacterized protein EHS24_005600 [Apiotrichum porosum]|uniref:FAD dependent oxidoreductase domain-containing protein n=1 Tax=Apiotrichum porosum TaxID=105984 RepID=A0A427XC96_9TREE|nr:uncharacterized protein EHS24_005600 [Apiotrichum porosum]RSH76510.1 hypothetical protein EHS24_005600 [Apiotrichum porosum]
MTVPDYDVAIVGAGIAAARSPRSSLLMPVSFSLTATSRARVVAQINTLPVLTELARRSVAAYTAIPNGFDNVGCLEVVRGADGKNWIQDRVAVARERKLEHSVLTTKEAQSLAPAFVHDDATGAIYYPNDGTANAKTHYRLGQTYTITTSDDAHTARRVVVATGVWAGQLCPCLASRAVAFAHPYAFANRHAPRTRMAPFARFPDAVMYVRDHGDRIGIGSYNHDPVVVRTAATKVLPTAYTPFQPQFTHTMDDAIRLLPPSTAATFAGRVDAQPAELTMLAAGNVPYGFTGVFTITPDGLPLVGRINLGMYAAIGAGSHAAGSMRVLADLIVADIRGEDAPEADEWLRAALDPCRFHPMADVECESHAVDKYKDIWNKKDQAKVLAAL